MGMSAVKTPDPPEVSVAWTHSPRGSSTLRALTRICAGEVVQPSATPSPFTSVVGPQRSGVSSITVMPMLVVQSNCHCVLKLMTAHWRASTLFPLVSAPTRYGMASQSFVA